MLPSDAPPPTANALRLHRDDDVAVLTEAVDAGGRIVVSGTDVVLCAVRPVPLGHKVALSNLPKGHAVRKHGAVIGSLTDSVAAGDHVHVHNLSSIRTP